MTSTESFTTESSTTESTQAIGWQPYKLDHHAQTLVLANRDKRDVLNESHKMRMTVAYGLERFWGEHLRLERESRDKGNYWKAVWNALGDILDAAKIQLPGRNREAVKTEEIQAIATEIWQMTPEHRQIALMVLTQLCDALVWWTQRYKIRTTNR